MPCMKGRSSQPMRLCSLSQPPRSSFNTMVTRHSWDTPAAWYLLDRGAIVKPADAICTTQHGLMLAVVDPKGASSFFICVDGDAKPNSWACSDCLQPFSSSL